MCNPRSVCSLVPRSHASIALCAYQCVVDTIGKRLLNQNMTFLELVVKKIEDPFGQIQLFYELIQSTSSSTTTTKSSIGCDYCLALLRMAIHVWYLLQYGG